MMQHHAGLECGGQPADRRLQSAGSPRTGTGASCQAAQVAVPLLEAPISLHGRCIDTLLTSCLVQTCLLNSDRVSHHGEARIVSSRMALVIRSSITSTGPYHTIQTQPTSVLR